jgi:hypothetical protein
MDDLALEPPSDASTATAVRVAAAEAGLRLEPGVWSAAWWQAGVADSLARTVESLEPREASRYEAARSPRRTRGATRA